MRLTLWAALAAAAAASACQTPGFTDEATLYYGFSRIDPVSERVTPNSWLVVEGDTIAALGAGAPPRHVDDRRDMSGTYAMPGLIDAHAHITSGPHKIAFKDGAPAITIESVDRITEFNAAVALAFGVTTVRNPGGDPVANAAYDEKIASGEWIGPEAFHAGAVIQPPPFVGGAFAYPRTSEEWRAEAARQAALGMRYFKLYVSLTEEELAEGVAAAHAHGMKAIAHLDRVSWLRAVELGVDGLEHALPTSPDLLEPAARAAYLAELGPDSKHMYRWFERVDYEGPLMQRLFTLLADKKIETNLTLVVNELTYNIDRLDAVWPPEDRRFTHPETLTGSLNFLTAGAAAWTTDDFDRARAAMPRVLDFARRLYEADVPMMIGTDGHGGGPAYARELQLHLDAGIPPWAVLRMATSQSARMIGIDGRTGRLAQGMEADVVFLADNPLQDAAHARDTVLVLNNGVAYDPETLLRQALSFLN